MSFAAWCYFLKLYFLYLTIWNSNIHNIISIDITSGKILALQKKVTMWRYYSEFLKSNTKSNISPLRMRSQGCPGFQNFWNFVLKMNLLVCSAKIQLKLSKLPKYGQKQRFFRSFFAFFAFFQFWLNISASNCQNLIWHEIFDLLTPLWARSQCLKRKLTESNTAPLWSRDAFLRKHYCSWQLRLHYYCTVFSHTEQYLNWSLLIGSYYSYIYSLLIFKYVVKRM